MSHSHERETHRERIKLTKAVQWTDARKQPSTPLGSKKGRQRQRWSKVGGSAHAVAEDYGLLAVYAVAEGYGLLVGAADTPGHAWALLIIVLLVRVAATAALARAGLARRILKHNIFNLARRLDKGRPLGQESLELLSFGQEQWMARERQGEGERS